MAFDDALIGSGDDFDPRTATESLIRQTSPTGPLPVTLDPRMLNTRLARKLGEPMPAAEPVDIKPEKAEAPDFSGQAAEPEVTSPNAELDFSAQAVPANTPQTPPAPPALGVGGQLAAAAKGVPHGAIEHTGGILKGAARLHNDAQPYLKSLEYDPYGNIIEQKPVQPAAPIAEHPLYKAGKATADFAQTIAPMSEQEKDSIGGRVGAGAGSIIPYALTTVIAGPLAGLGSGAIGMATDTFGQVFEEAKKHGAADDVAESAAARSALVAGVLGSLPLGAGKYAKTLISKVASSSAAFATLGEAQEAILQEIAKDYDPKAGYTFEQKRLIAALILGAGMGGLHHAFDRRGQQQPGQQQPGAQPTGPGGQVPPPGAQPGPNPNGWPGGTGSWGTPPPGGGPQPGAGPRPGAGTPPPGGGAGPQPGGPGAGAGPQPGAKPGGPPPGSGTGKAGDPSYTMDPAMRAKMERIYRTFERGKSPSNLSDGELYDAVNEHLRDTSSTGYTAKPETPEEAAAREQAATERTEREALKRRGWTDAHINAMTPEQRRKYFQDAMAGEQTPPPGDRAADSAQQRTSAEAQRPENVATSPDDVRAATSDRYTQAASAPVKPTSKSDVPRATGTRGDPIEIRTAEDVAAVTAPASGDYTHAQGEANNRQLGHGKWNDRAVRMEVAKGGVRKMQNPETGEPVEVTHGGAAYGYFPGTTGADGMHVDLYLGDHPESPNVYVIDEIDRNTGKFRQHKVMGGFPTERDAFAAYVQTSTKGPETVGGITRMSRAELNNWLDSGNTTKALKPTSTGPDKTVEAGPRPLTEATGEAPKETPAGDTGARAADRSATPTPKPRAGSDQPLSLLQFIASKGGLAPHTELSALGFDGKRRVQIPGRKGFFGVVRPGGMSLDYMREAIEEAGYLRGEAGQTSTVRQLLDAMSEEDRGNRLDAEGNEGTLSKREQVLAREREEHERERHEIEYGTATADLIDAGYTGLRNDLHDAAVRLMVDEGMSPDDAVERAALHLVATDGDYAVTPDTIKDTFGGGTYDEIRAAAASEDGGRSPRQREEGARPGEGQEDRGDGTDVPDSGAQGRETAGEVAQARAEVEAALGPDADIVLPVDIARAAEIMVDNPGIPPEIAFGQAVAAGTVEQGFLTKEQAEAAYGPEINDVLESGQEGTPVRAGDVEQERAKPDESGAGDTAQGGVVSRGGKTRGKGAEGETDRAVAETAAGKAGTAARRDETARDETGDTDRDRAAAEDADKPVGEFIADIERRIAEGDYDADIAPTRSIKDFREAAEARGWVHGAYGKGKALWSPDRKHAMLYHVAVEGNYVNVHWGEPTEGVTPPPSAKVLAADADETVTVTLSRQGPWDFNDTFPAPDPKHLAAMEREGRAVFDDPTDPAEIADAVDAGVYDMIEEMGIIRTADAEIAAVRAGKIKLKKKESAADRIAALTKERAKAIEMLRGHQGTFEDVFGKDAARAMMIEARKRIVQEEGQRDKGVERKLPEQKPEPAVDDRRGQPIVETGAVFKTVSGRETAPAPKIDATSERKTKKALFNLDSWLLDEARKEVAGNDYQLTLLKGLDPKKFTQSDRDTVNQLLFGDADGPRPSDLVRVEGKAAKPKSFDDMTEADKKAAADAPTWAEILAELPMHKDGHTREHEIAFAIMKEIAGKKATRFDKLTPEQKHELLARVKARKEPALAKDDFDDIFNAAVEEQFAKPAPVDDVAKRAEQILASDPLKAVAFNDAERDVYRQIDANISLKKWPKESEDAIYAAARRAFLTSVANRDSLLDIKDMMLKAAEAAVPTTETGADGKPQMVIPGAEKASDKTMAQRGANAGLKPKVAQKPVDIGLFGDDSKQSDMMDMLAKAPPPPQGGSMSLDDVAKGLGALFGKKPPGLSEQEPQFSDDTYQQALPYFKAGVAHFAAGDADLTTMVRALVKHLAGAGMDADAIRAMKPYIKRFTEDVTAGRETIHAPSSSDVLESGGGKPATSDTVGEANVPAPAGGAGRRPRGRGKAADAGDERPGGGERLPETHAPVVGENGNLELPAREPVDEGGDAADRESQRGGDDGEAGFSFDDGATDEAVRNAQKDADVNARRERQRQAEGIEVIDDNLANIAETLPMLHPEQHGDVLAAEQRFAKPDGHGMLFTNGTGTGKTYSGLGIIKRFTKKGKGQILVVAPSQGILTDWMRSAKDLGLDMHVLTSTVDKGRPGLNGTTYANLGDNPTLADQDWQLVVADEAHKLSSDQEGTATKALGTLRALTKHPDGMRQRAEMVLRRDWDEVMRLKPPEKGATNEQQQKFAAAYRAFKLKSEPLIAKWRNEPRPKALMMSATPFAYHFSLDYAEGYLFEFDRSKDSNGGYNAPTGRDAFYMQHLGYRKRVGKLTKPDADVKQEIMERQLHEYLKKTGALSGRALTVDKDYDRKFVLAHNAAGELIDRALNFLQEAEGGRYRPLHEIISKQFDYLARMRLLEAMKAQDAIGYIKEAHALGRKVVVFHDYNEGGGISPFTHRPPTGIKVTSYVNGKHVESDLASLYDDFAAQNPYIKELDFGKYPAPIYTLTQAFPNALVYNGNIPNKKRNEAKRLFNDDNSGHDLIIVQSAAGEAGISLHDTTGKKQRVLLNLGMPIRPTTSIQQEGRIYRVGQSSDAIFRYMNTGTDWERWTFAGKIADRAGTAENLALGNLARTIKQSFIDAFETAGDYRPEPGEGKGGKDLDRATTHSMSEFEKAKTHYFAQAKITGRRNQREGIDYYATPEPIGFKMVEFAGLKPGEKILEPSAGHGAIARYFPEDSARTLVEPSSSLASRAALTSPGARVVVDSFENLDVGANKFDAIVMNPPFGSGGKTAIEHLEKAVKHLRNGGRIVALIPRSDLTDRRFDTFMDSPAAKGIYIVGNIALPMVTFERAGTQIATRIVVLEKQTDAEVSQRLQQKDRDYTSAEKIGELFDRIENADMGPRLEPLTKDAEPTTTGVVTIDGIELKIGAEAKPGAVVYVDLKNKIGIDKFKRVMRAAEANEGRYIKTLKSIEFANAAARDRFLEALRNPPAEPEQPSAPSGVTFKTGETKHAKTGADLFVATAEQRVDSDVYSQMAAAAKAHGGWYSPYKGRGAIPGFQFKSAEARKAFLDQMSGGLGEAPQRRPAGESGQQWALEQGRKTGTEYMVAYGADGREMGRTGGKLQRFVAFTPEFVTELNNPANDIVAHHNHPGGTSLSNTDLMALAFPGLRAIWAHGNNGNVYRGELTPAFEALVFPTPNAKSKKIEGLYKIAQWRLQPIIQVAVTARAVTVDEANGGLNHLVNEVLADAGIIDYRSNYELGDFVSRVPDLDKSLKTAVAAVRKEAFGATADSNRVDRRAGPLRHVGDLGASFDRADVAAAVGGEGRSSPLGEESDFREEGPGLAQPDNTFKKPGSFDSSIGDILGRRLLGRMSDLNATEARTQLQDKFARVKNAEESVGAPSTLSAYQAESLYYGRTGHRLEQLRENHIDPIIREMKARDVELGKLDDFLSASHAPERNDKIGAMYPPHHDFNRAMRDHDIVGGSGWSTNEALRVIRDLRASGKLSDYLAVARMVWALNFRTRRALYDAGLIDRDTFDAWNAAYKYYTPQRGHAEGDQFMPSSSGMNVRGKEARTAFGRRSKADSPLAYSIMQAEMAIIRAEKKKVGNTFLQFVRANPDPARWTVDRPPLVKRIDPATGLVTSMPNNLYADHDNVFTTKENGKDVYITLHGPDGLNLARALKNMGTANVHKFIRAYATVTHTMAKMATAWNPEFMIPNLIRDVGEAFINLSAQQQRDFVRKFVGHMGGAMKGSSEAIAIGHNGGPPLTGDPYVDAFNRFDKAGGRIRFFGIDDPDAIEINVNKRLARLDGGTINNVKDMADKLGKALEIAGGGIENATRLAAFMAAEDVGMSTADAAMLARNLTVDFNKKGELGGAISALYMFANAGIQGQARMIKALGHRRVWAAVGALAAAAALSTLFSLLNGETDEADTPAYMKVPKWERDKNLIFMMPSGLYFKVPLPYGFAPFGVIGSRSITTLMGHDAPGVSAHAVMDSILNAFNPLGEESGILMDLIPSAMRPAFHIYFNKNWTGKDLYPEQDKQRGARPDSTQSFKSDSAFSKEAARLLNEWSGGGPYKSGNIDVHPASIDHTLQAITGGVGRFVKGIADSFYRNVITGEEWQPEKTPILRRFVGKIGEQHDAALFYEKRKEVRDLAANAAQAKKDQRTGTNAEAAREFLANDKIVTQKAIFERADNAMSRLRQNETEINNSSRPDEEKRTEINRIRQEMRSIQNKARAESVKLNRQGASP